MAEEEDQEVMIKHVCKFCNKNFPCGRSLGGHMRSHVTNAETTENCVAMKKKKNKNNNKLSSSSSSLNNEEAVGYGLRENPKKTWRFTDSSGEDRHQKEKDSKFVVLDKLCKECGKGFQSLKALFGHMKCHSERVSKNTSFDDHHHHDQESWKVMVMDNSSQSDTEETTTTTTVPKRKKRSKRRRTRYTNFAAISSISVSDAELEQEEVALSLMMLSRDVSNWGGVNSNNNSNSLYFEAPLTDLVDNKIEVKKRVISNCSEMAKLTKSKDKKKGFGNSASSILNSKGKSSELLDTESPGIESTKVKKPKLEAESAAFEVNGEELAQSRSNNKYTSMKSSSTSMRNSEGEFSRKSSNKRAKYECTTCKKKFNSYQALGGHRASHKRNKGCCFASRNESSENITAELEESSELMKSSDIIEADHDLEAVKKTTSFDNDDEKNIEHEVPIFVKRSHHLAGESESSSTILSQSQTIMLQESVQETRSMLDLNLPAATDEESSGHNHAEPCRSWWMGLLAN